MRFIAQDCPFCEAKTVYRCRCMLADKRCANGHEWHQCQEHEGRIVEGPADHGRTGCTCRPGHTFIVGLVKLNCLA